MNKTYDLIVLGSGGAAWRAASACKQAGWSVALINDGLMGGTCPTRGCIPKKVLASVAEIADINRRLAGLDIIESQPIYSWQNLIKHKHSFTDPVPPATEKAAKEAGFDVFKGKARFVDNLSLEINGQRLSGKKIHIAVGATPAKLPIDGAQHLIISDDFLNLEDLPKRIIFVGGGYISFEFAHIAARFGAQVTILHGDNQPLPQFDKDIIETLQAASKEIGINAELNSAVKSINKKGETFVVATSSGATFEADCVVHGAGRVPALDGMNLEATGVDYDKHRGIFVDESMRSTSNPDVYAAGDAAASGPPLSPVAGAQGAIVASNLLGTPKKQPSYISTPSVIFTTPTVGKVGLLEREAKEKHLDFDVITNDLTGWFDAARLDLKHAKSKVLVEKQSHKILGAHLIGNHAEDLINIFSLAIELGLTTEQLKQPILAFPTSSDDMRSMF